MNLLLLLAGSQAWRAVTPLVRLMRVITAISIFSLEMQIITWLEIGSLQALPLVNLILAVAALAVWRPAPAATRQNATRPEPRAAVWIGAALVLGALVVALNLTLFEAADPYHLEKVDRIERSGTLAYDPNTESKINVVSSLYELVLADLRQIPGVGPLMIRLHGLWSLLYWLLAIAVARELLRASPATGAGEPLPTAPAVSSVPRWPWIVLLVVPTVFHQLVLIKNDLFVAVPAFAALTWALTRAATAGPRDIALVFWLAGFAVAVKLTTLPLLVVAGGALLVARVREWRAIAAAALGTVAGVTAGGLLFTLAMNVRVYGQLMPVADVGSINPGVTEVMTGVGRFLVSLVDLGLLTRVWWPGRGGWGGTVGLPFIWACAVLLWASRRLPLARVALLYAAVYFLAFALVFPDADLSHRLALAPALLLIGLAVRIVEGGVDSGVEGGAERGDEWRPWRMALVPVILLSAAQIARSASEYFMR